MKIQMKLSSLLLLATFNATQAFGQSITFVDSILITPDSSARPEIAVYNNKAYVVYLNTIQPRTFDIKIFDTDFNTEYYYRKLFSGNPLIGYPTDIRIAQDSLYLVTFFETAAFDSVRLWGARYIMDDSLSVETEPFLISTALPEPATQPGQLLLNDPTPLITNNAIYVGCRLRDPYRMADSSRIYFWQYDKTTFTETGQFLLDLTNIAGVNGGVRVFSLLYRDNTIYLTLNSSISDSGVIAYEPSFSDIVLVKLDPNWNVISAQTIYQEDDSKPLQVSGLQHESGYYFLTYVMGKLMTGYSRIEIFDSHWNPVLSKTVLTNQLGPGSTALRASICVKNNRIFSGNSYPVAGASAIVVLYDFSEDPVSVELSKELNIPSTTWLSQNYPNPFNPTTTLKYAIQQSSFVRLKIYDELGRLVKNLVNEKKPAGEYSVIWDGKDEKGELVSSGIYFYTLTIGDNTAISRSMLFLK